MVSKIKLIEQFFISGYMFCPGNCVFGPWTSYQDYIGIYHHQPNWRPSWYRPYWLGQMLTSLGLSLFFVALSSCVTHYLFPDSSWKWIMAYRYELLLLTLFIIICGSLPHAIHDTMIPVSMTPFW